MNKTNRNPVIDIARMVFCFGVINLHMNPIRIASEPNLIMCFGYLGVEFFFILSGYLMAIHAQKALSHDEIELGSETWSFIGRKFLSIFPYYIISWVICFLLARYPDRFAFEYAAKDMILSIPYILQLELAGFSVFPVNDPSWFLSAMFLAMMILYPLLLRFRSSFSKLIAPITAIWCYGYLFTVCGKLSTIEPLEGTFLHTGMLRAFGGICLGCFLHEVQMACDRASPERASVSSGVALTVVELLCYIGAVLCMRTTKLCRTDFLFILLVSVAITISFSGRSFSGRVFKRAYPWIGKLSMCLYLTNSPARRMTVLLLPEELNISRLVPHVLINIVLGVLVMFAGDALNRLIKKRSLRAVKT